MAAKIGEVIFSRFFPSSPANVTTHPARQCVVLQVCQLPIFKASFFDAASKTFWWMLLIIGTSGKSGLSPFSNGLAEKLFFLFSRATLTQPEQREQREQSEQPEQPEQREQREQSEQSEQFQQPLLVSFSFSKFGCAVAKSSLTPFNSKSFLSKNST
jgi:hypothetical protein